jgi:hypothetical protein
MTLAQHGHSTTTSYELLKITLSVEAPYLERNPNFLRQFLEVKAAAALIELLQ